MKKKMARTFGTNWYKKCALILAEPIHHLICETFRQRKFPSAWKLADVVPIPKSSDLSIENTRPISHPFQPKLQSKLFFPTSEHLLLNYLVPISLVFDDIRLPHMQ